MKTLHPFYALRAVLLCLLLPAAFGGCTLEDARLEVPASGRVYTVSYSFETPLSRAAATGPEKEVRDVAVFFYKADEDPANESYIDCQSVTVPEGGGTAGSFPLPLPPTILQGQKYRLLVIGNYKKYAPEGKSLTQYAADYSTRTYSKMKQEIQGQLASDIARVTAPLPFYGVLLGKDGEETSLTGPAPTDTDLGVSVKFSRAVARFDVSNLVADRLKIEWVKVCNYRNKGYFYHESAPAGDIVRGTSATPPSPGDLPLGYVDAPDPTGLPGSLRQDLNGGGLYAFPNIVSYTAQDDKQTTCLMIAGYYQAPGQPENTTRLTYYRANVSDNGSGQFLKRNYVYTLTIGNVKSEGAETEEGAVNEKEKLLDYVVDDSWESESGSTVTDNTGNFLTLSRTSVVLASSAGSSEVIKVSVKQGTGWKPEWKNNPDNAFRFERVNDKSFSIITNGDNNELFTRNAALTVSVTGISSTVSLTINVIQMSSINDPQMLTVEGRSGDFDYTVPGQGGIVSLQVITGSAASRWKAEVDNNLVTYINEFTPEGSNSGSLSLTFLANTEGERRGTATVRRYLADGTPDNNVPPVHVTFVQATSPYKVTLIPSFLGRLEIDGFTSRTGSQNGVSYSQRFNVILADPVNYTFKATSTFNKNSDAFLSLDNRDDSQTAGPLQTSKTDYSIVTGESGQNLFLNVFRTGPGDRDIEGEIIVTAVPKPGTSLSEFTVSQSVVIKSGCKIGDIKAGNLLWADRNVGTMPRGPGGSLVGLNYSNDPLSDDNGLQNGSYKGTYHSFFEAPNECASFGTNMHYEGDLATGWRVPSNAEQGSIAGRMLFSKQRAFALSDNKIEGNVGCWFPLSGSSDSPKEIKGIYWSTDRMGTTGGYFLELQISSAVTAGDYYSDGKGRSVRCVRDITP